MSDLKIYSNTSFLISLIQNPNKKEFKRHIVESKGFVLVKMKKAGIKIPTDYLLGESFSLFGVPFIVENMKADGYSIEKIRQTLKEEIENQKPYIKIPLDKEGFIQEEKNNLIEMVHSNLDLWSQNKDTSKVTKDLKIYNDVSLLLDLKRTKNEIKNKGHNFLKPAHIIELMEYSKNNTVEIESITNLEKCLSDVQIIKYRNSEPIEKYEYLLSLVPVYEKINEIENFSIKKALINFAQYIHKYEEDESIPKAILVYTDWLNNYKKESSDNKYKNRIRNILSYAVEKNIIKDLDIWNKDVFNVLTFIDLTWNNDKEFIVAFLKCFESHPMRGEMLKNLNTNIKIDKETLKTELLSYFYIDKDTRFTDLGLKKIIHEIKNLHKNSNEKLNWSIIPFTLLENEAVSAPYFFIKNIINQLGDSVAYDNTKIEYFNMLTIKEKACHIDFFNLVIKGFLNKELNIKIDGNQLIQIADILLEKNNSNEMMNNIGQLIKMILDNGSKEEKIQLVQKNYISNIDKLISQELLNKNGDFEILLSKVFQQKNKDKMGHNNFELDDKNVCFHLDSENLSEFFYKDILLELQKNDSWKKINYKNITQWPSLEKVRDVVLFIIQQDKSKNEEIEKLYALVKELCVENVDKYQNLRSLVINTNYLEIFPSISSDENFFNKFLIAEHNIKNILLQINLNYFQDSKVLKKLIDSGTEEKLALVLEYGDAIGLLGEIDNLDFEYQRKLFVNYPNFIVLMKNQTSYDVKVKVNTLEQFDNIFEILKKEKRSNFILNGNLNKYSAIKRNLDWECVDILNNIDFENIVNDPLLKQRIINNFPLNLISNFQLIFVLKRNKLYFKANDVVDIYKKITEKCDSLYQSVICFNLSYLLDIVVDNSSISAEKIMQNNENNLSIVNNLLGISKNNPKLYTHIVLELGKIINDESLIDDEGVFKNIPKKYVFLNDIQRHLNQKYIKELKVLEEKSQEDINLVKHYIEAVFLKEYVDINVLIDGWQKHEKQSYETNRHLGCIPFYIKNRAKVIDIFNNSHLQSQIGLENISNKLLKNIPDIALSVLPNIKYNTHDNFKSNELKNDLQKIYKNYPNILLDFMLFCEKTLEGGSMLFIKSHRDVDYLPSELKDILDLFEYGKSLINVYEEYKIGIFDNMALELEKVMIDRSFFKMFFLKNIENDNIIQDIEDEISSRWEGLNIKNVIKVSLDRKRGNIKF